MGIVKNLKGKKYGMLLVLRQVPIKEYKEITGQKPVRAMRECKCLCGNKTIVRGNNLTYGNQTSCGCRMKFLLEDKKRVNEDKKRINEDKKKDYHKEYYEQNKITLKFKERQNYIKNKELISERKSIWFFKKLYNSKEKIDDRLKKIDDKMKKMQEKKKKLLFLRQAYDTNNGQSTQV